MVNVIMVREMSLQTTGEDQYNISICGAHARYSYVLEQIGYDLDRKEDGHEN